MKMKKLLILPILMTLVGCEDKPNESTIENTRIMCPTGAPSIALSSFSTYQNFETTADPSLLMGYFASGNYDIIVAPTDVGVKAINQGADYQLAATITFGNFFLVSTGNDQNNTLENGDSIVLFQQNALPDKIFHYVYGTSLDSNITYVKNVAVAATAYENKKVTTDDGTKIDVDYVLLAEPKLTALNVTDGIINLSTEFKNKAESSLVYQASIFTKNDYEFADEFLNTAKTSIETMISNPEEIVSNMDKVSDPQTFFGMPSAMAKKITQKNNGLAIGFKYAKDEEQGIKKYLAIIGVNNVSENVIKK